MTPAQTTAQTTAQQNTTFPRDLTDAAAKREAAKEYIEQYMREHGGYLPSGEMVGNEFGLTDKWGRNQLKPYRRDETSPASGTPPQLTVGQLVAQRSGAPVPAGPAKAVIVATGPERPAGPPARPERPAAPPARPERRAAPPARPERRAPAPAVLPERSAATTATTAATSSATGTASPRSGIPASSVTGTLTPEPTRRHNVGRNVGEFVALLPLLAIAAGAFVSIWGGWVGLGQLTGFGEIELLPGIAPGWKFNTAITLPLGMEAYAAYALKVWLAPPAGLTEFGRTFARRSAIAALVLGALGQIAYHLMAAAEVEHAPWPITMFVACLPVGVLGCGAALAHIVRHPERGRS